MFAFVALLFGRPRFRVAPLSDGAALFFRDEAVEAVAPEDVEASDPFEALNTFATAAATFFAVGAGLLSSLSLLSLSLPLLSLSLLLPLLSPLLSLVLLS